MIINQKKDNEGVDIAEAAPLISQTELHEYVAQARVLQRVHDNLRESLTERLEKGAGIEPGELTAKIEIENKRRWNWTNIAEIIGLEGAWRLWQRLQSARYRRLLVLDAEGSDVAWREWRLKNQSRFIAGRLPLAPSAPSSSPDSCDAPRAPR